MTRKGYDILFADPGARADADCLVCGARCRVKRNVYGPTSFVEAVGRKSRRHDAFSCPYSGEEWHERALQLVLAIEATPSPRVARLMELDLADLLRKRKHRK